MLASYDLFLFHDNTICYGKNLSSNIFSIQEEYAYKILSLSKLDSEENPISCQCWYCDSQCMQTNFMTKGKIQHLIKSIIFPYN